MEPQSAAHTVLETPELVLLLSAHLTPADLAQCNLVCKDWSRQFEPILWTNFRPEILAHSSNNALPPALTAALRRNLPHIRTLELCFADDTILQVLTHGPTPESDDPERDSSTLCTNLRRIKFEDVAYKRLDPTSVHLATLLSLNRHLTHLDLPYDFLESSAVLAAISNLSHLQHLTIHSFEGAAKCRQTLLLLKACLALPELSKLAFIEMELNWDVIDKSKDKDMPDAETIISEASIARFAQWTNATKIKTLRLPTSRAGARYPLPCLLLKSDLLDLESCEIPWFRKDADIEQIEQVVRKHYPNLKHLICPCFRGEREQDGQAVCAFIRGCSGLRGFTSELFSDYDAESFDSTYFDDDYSDLEPRMIISEVVSRHYNTLEVIDLTDCWQVFSNDQQSVLSRCTQLKRFWVTDSFGEGSMVSIESPHIWLSDWVCSELRELSLVLNLRPKSELALDEVKVQLEADDEWLEDDEEELIPMLTERVYTRIGGLKKLEILALDMDRSFENNMMESDYAWNLTISSGYLSELAELKCLKRLILGANLWSTMGQAEVEFMYTNWPLLNEITICGDISQLRALPHWQWLLNKRPQLRLKGSEELHI